VIVVNGVEYYVASDFDLPSYTVHDRAKRLMIDNTKINVNGYNKRAFTKEEKLKIDSYVAMKRGRAKRTEPRVCKVCGKSELEVKFPSGVLYCNSHYRKKIITNRPIGKEAFLEKFKKEAWQERFKYQ